MSSRLLRQVKQSATPHRVASETAEVMTQLGHMMEDFENKIANNAKAMSTTGEIELIMMQAKRISDLGSARKAIYKAAAVVAKVDGCGLLDINDTSLDNEPLHIYAD